jgi:carbon-monoxide dehydrogenase medium subunit/6-hydroxypseudooxynicotine dehydrogenase subunit alpha
MKPPPFEYVRAGSVDEAVAALDEDAKILAGGQSLLPALNYRLVRPARLVDIDRLAELDELEVCDGVRIGALVRHARLEREVRLSGPWRAVREAAAHVGHLPIRTRGTFGGSLAHADPAAELCVAALAFDGNVVARSPAGERTLAAADLFLGPFSTALGPDELVTEVVLPPGPESSAFEEFAPRAGDYAFASACVVRGRDGARVALGSVGATPLRARTAEQALAAGEPPEVVGRTAAAECEPTSDSHASAAYRQALVATLVERAVRRLEESV